MRPEFDPDEARAVLRLGVYMVAVVLAFTVIVVMVAA